MKLFYTLFAFILFAQLQAQSSQATADRMIRDFSRFWANASSEKMNPNRGVDITHQLDSVVTKNGFDQSVARTEMDYDDQHRTTQLRGFSPDSLTGALYLDAVISMDYFGSNLPAHVRIEGFDTDLQQLVTVLEMEIFYDGLERMDSMVISAEDPFFGGFGPLLSTKNVYNGDLLVQTRQWFYFALLGGWIPSGFTDYQYDGEGHLLDALTSVVDISTGDILPDSRSGYEYNADGLLEIQTDYIWEDPNWTPTQRFMYAYYGNGTLMRETDLLYDNGIFVNYQLTQYAVEEVDDQYPSATYLWDAISQNWIHSDSTINHLNTSLPWSKVAKPSQLSVLGAAGYEIGFDFNGSSIINTEYFFWDTMGTQLFFDAQDIYYYSLIEGSGTSTILPEYLSVDPNPSQGIFTIRLDDPQPAEYSIFNETGALVDHGKINASRKNFSTASWSPGLYYVVILLEDGKRYTHKQIVQ